MQQASKLGLIKYNNRLFFIVFFSSGQIVEECRINKKLKNIKPLFISPLILISIPRE